jgi:predicted Zn-dependent peptidase
MLTRRVPAVSATRFEVVLVSVASSIEMYYLFALFGKNPKHRIHLLTINRHALRNRLRRIFHAAAFFKSLHNLTFRHLKNYNQINQLTRPHQILTEPFGLGFCTRKTIDNDIVKENPEMIAQILQQKEIEFYKNQIKGSILLGSEDIENRMNSLAVNELIFKKSKSVKQIQQEIEQINYDSVHQYIENYLDLDQLAGILLGPKVENHSLWWENFAG